MTQPTEPGTTEQELLIPGTTLRVSAYFAGGGNDLVVAINAPGIPCLARFIMTDLLKYSQDLGRVKIGDCILTPTLPPR